MNPSVYLAGPITGLTYEQGQDWRKVARNRLWSVGIDGFSPLRCKQYLREFGELDNAGHEGGQYRGVNPLSEPQGIMTRDRNDVRTRDMVLANMLGAEIVSIGTCIELGWADAYRKPVVLVMEEDNVHRHAMVNQAAGFIVPTLDDALEIVQAVLLP